MIVMVKAAFELWLIAFAFYTKFL